MSAILLVSGVGVILVVLVDIFLTTLTTSGAGPLSSRVGETLWRLLLRRHGRREAHRLLAIGGPVIMATLVGLWVVMLWTGWSLIFNADETAVVDSLTQEPADVWARIYFAGFNLFTLGLGDYRPNGSAWQIATALTVANGLLTITLAITYLVPILSAAAEKRRLAATIAGLGTTPVDILRRSWDGKSFGALEQHLVSLGPMISLQAQQHLAYPVLRYFHSANAQTALAPRLAALDEALGLLRHAVAPELRMHKTVTEPLAGTIDGFLHLLSGETWKANSAPEPIRIDALRAVGIPLDEMQDFDTRIAAMNEHRRRLLGYVQSDGWSWEEVVG